MMNEQDKQILIISHLTRLVQIYQYSREDIEKRIKETYDRALEETIKNKKNFIWTTVKDSEESGNIRMPAIIQFKLKKQAVRISNGYSERIKQHVQM